MKFVELDRRFRKLNPLENPEEAALESYTASLLDLESGLGWEGLLERPLVVVLGEPGSGKTWEFRECARKLGARAENAFLIPLDRLISEPLTEILSPEENSRFRVWLRKGEEATFFLDSVDEAKHQRTSDFLVALDRFRNAIGSNNLVRLHLLISSRINEWRPQSDEHELIARFPQPPPLRSKKQEPDADDSYEKTEKQEEILVVQIEPLDRSRVERFTRELDINDPAAFIRALDEKHAWPFARRPIDVIDLLNYWNEHHKLGSLKDLIEHDLNQKLKETREKQDLLTPGRARQGAEILGAAVALCRNFNFRVPDDSHLTDVVAIDVAACLPVDWLPMERQMLLNRPLFDSASYGRIRFHHRRSAEYLAARWLANRMEEGCPTPILEDLLFTRIRNQDVIRSSLSPVAAWLCGGKERWQEDIRNCVLKAAPWIHLQHGDPSQLSIEYRRSLLNALVKLYEGRDRVWLDTEHESLSRLADPGLADDVVAIIRNRNVSTDLRCEMLRLVQHGRLTACLDAVLDLVADATESGDVKIYATIALRDVGETPHLLRLWEIIKRFSLISTRLCARCCEALYPNIIDAEGLADLLRKSEAVPRNAVDLPYYLRHHLEEVVTPMTSGCLLIQLISLLEQKPHLKKDTKEIPLSVNFSWMGEVIPFVLKVLLEKDFLTDAEIDATAHSFCLLGLLHRSMIVHKPDLIADLNALTGRHPEVRRRFFWRLVEERKSKKRSETELTYPIHLFSQLDVVKPTPGDLEWAIDDINTRKEEADRVIALRMAIGLWRMAGAKWGDRQCIRHATVNDASLLKEFKRLAEYSPLVWIKRIWYRHIKYKLTDEWWWKSRIYSTRQRYREFQWQWAYMRHIRLLKNGQATGWLSDLARETDESHSQWAPRTWNKLVEKRGRLIAWAAREGCKSVWQEFVPLLPHEKPISLQTDHRVIVGLAGLQAAFSENELDFKQLSEDDARLAVRYAVNELNGFPLWLPELAKQHPLAVRDVLTECIRGEWQFDAKREHVHEVLSVLAWHGEGLLPLVRDSMIAQIQAGDPLNASVLETALTLLLKDSDLSAATLAGIAADRITQYSTDSRGFMLWLVVWLQFSAGPALRYLQQILSKAPDADELMVRLCAMLHGDSRQQSLSVPSSDYGEPTHLRTFIPLIYRHIRPREQIDPVGGRTLTARDDARRFRDSLLEHLSQSESAEADDVLHEFLDEPALAAHRDYILHLLDQRAERQADSPPWNPEDILAFAKDYETDPKTDRDLFKIACRRLYEIKNAVEKADKSVRFEMHEEYDERKLRIWLASKLQERSRNRYMVPQEEEIDRRERPDLRVERPGMAPVSIEIKWADKDWTLQDLLNGLENQLVGQYLRDDNSRYGIYLLGYIGRKNFWVDPDNSSRLSFDQVVIMINDRAKAIVAERRNVEDIAVISMDFTDR